jgi:hypothetical protein
MTMDNIFFRLEANLSYGRSPVKIASLVKYDTLAPLTKESPIVKHNNFTVASGTKWYDIVQFSDSFKFVISRKVKDLLTTNNIKGWDSFPIQIQPVDKEYYGFIVTSMAGNIENLEALNNYEADYAEFDIKTWDGNDIFTLKDTLIIACTQKVKDLLEANGITNLDIKRL